MIDVGGDDRPSARHLVAHELGRDVIGKGGAEALAVAHHSRGLEGGAAEVLAHRDVFHLRSDDAAPGIGHLGDGDAALAAQRLAAAGKRELGKIGGTARPVAIVLGTHRPALVGLDVAASLDPGPAQRRQAGMDVYGDGGIGIGAGGVIDPYRRLARRRGEIDLAHGHPEVREQRPRHVNLPRGRQRPGGDRKTGVELASIRHVRHSRTESPIVAIR